MPRKIIILGFVLSIVGLMGWFLFVILSVLTLGKFRDAANFFGWMGLLSLPAAVIIKLAGFFMKKLLKNNKKAP